MTDRAAVNQHLDRLFRREAGRVVAVLTRLLGPGRLDEAESVLQDALLQAARLWPLKGIPDNPAAWIMQVARNRALDLLRAERARPRDDDALADGAGGLAEAGAMRELDAQTYEQEIRDDQLRMMFICCHPRLPFESRVALTLKTLFGLSVEEIARAFLLASEAVAQRLVRAKQRIKDERLPYEMPTGEAVVARLDSVLTVIYLLFNEGYAALEGDRLVRDDVCHEACRLADLLASHPVYGTPKAHALAAQLLLMASRLGTRVDAAGEVLLLADQDRAQWDRRLIAAGLAHLEQAARGDELSDFHLYAGIAACHAIAPTFDATDWARILDYYDLLLARSHSPVVALNRAVALSFVSGPAAGLREIRKIRSLPPLASYYLLPATEADFFRRLGEPAKAAKLYTKALELVRTAPERRFLERRLREVRG